METSLSYVRPHLKKKKSVVVRYSIPKIPALGSPRQEDEEFKASLVYRDLTEKQNKAKNLAVVATDSGNRCSGVVLLIAYLCICTLKTFLGLKIALVCASSSLLAITSHKLESSHC